MNKKNIYKILMRTIGAALPLRRHLGGGIGNSIRCFLAKRIVKSMGANCVVEKGAEIMEGCEMGDETGIGPFCYIGPGTIFKGYNLMGPNVHIFTTGHHYSLETHSFDGMNERKPVIIGKQVWIGYGVIILPGVTVGDHVIIGAGSVVSKNIPSGVLAAGNPCVVKKIIDPDYYNA